MYLTYIHTIVVQAARVQISCIPGMIITRFSRAVLSARSFYVVWDLSDLNSRVVEDGGG